jgi:hypothetical protein
MPILIEKPSIVSAAGNKPKVIEEYVGRVNSKTEALSIARMKSPSGWVEPGQRPAFDEYTVVLRGMLEVKTEKDTLQVKAGSAVIVLQSIFEPCDYVLSSRFLSWVNLYRCFEKPHWSKILKRGARK